MFAQYTARYNDIWQVPVQVTELTIEEFFQRHPGISNVFVAEKLGVEPNTVSSWKGGRNQTRRTKKQLWQLHKQMVSGEAFLF